MNKEFFVAITIILKDENNNSYFKNKAKRENAILHIEYQSLDFCPYVIDLLIA